MTDPLLQLAAARRWAHSPGADAVRYGALRQRAVAPVPLPDPCWVGVDTDHRPGYTHPCGRMGRPEETTMTTASHPNDALLAALAAPAAPYTVEPTARLPCGRGHYWGVQHKGEIIANVPMEGAVGRIRAQEIAAALNATTLAPQYGGPITGLAEGPVTLRAADGRRYRITAVFTDVAAANAYMAAHPDEALIGTQGDVALIATVAPEPADGEGGAT